MDAEMAICHTPSAEVDGARRPTHGQVVLVLQGGGALGAYQPGVYQAMHEAGVEPDWVVGTSIGAINGSIIAGNHPSRRFEQLHAFWNRMETNPNDPLSSLAGLFGNSVTNLGTYLGGIPGFFAPNPAALLGQNAPLGIENAAYYTTEPLRQTLSTLIDFDYLRSKATRLTVGAVNANSGEMRYFDSREDDIRVDHILASGAFPPAFPAVRIDGEPYWDGGIYSNTPVEVVLDDKPRRDSTIFAIQLWNAADSEPKTLADINERQKDIQFSTRDNTHIQRQQQIHKLRHIIREMSRMMPPELRETDEVRSLAAWGCSTTMHLVRLHAPRIKGEDASKDIDFSRHGIRTRWQAGYQDAKRALEMAPWLAPTDSIDGVVIHPIS
jgi:NTE family protein